VFCKLFEFKSKNISIALSISKRISDNLVFSISLICSLLAADLATDVRSAHQSFSIYCTSNFDGTGKCRRVDTDEEIGCVAIPGQVIACRDQQKMIFECVQYAAVVAYQTQFFCDLDDDQSVSDSLFEQSVIEPNNFKNLLKPGGINSNPAIGPGTSSPNQPVTKSRSPEQRPLRQQPTTTQGSQVAPFDDQSDDATPVNPNSPF